METWTKTACDYLKSLQSEAYFNTQDWKGIALFGSGNVGLLSQSFQARLCIGSPVMLKCSNQPQTPSLTLQEQYLHLTSLSHNLPYFRAE